LSKVELRGRKHVGGIPKPKAAFKELET